MGLMFRAHYAFARNPLTRSDGQEISALYGLCRYLLRTVNELWPTHVVMALDSKGPTFRHEALPGYKANRLACPDALAWQLQQLPRMARALGMTPVAVAGVEADDILATMAQKAASWPAEGEMPGCRTVILSSDKDMLQLISGDGNTSVFRVGQKRGASGGGGTQELRDEDVRSQFGVSASQFADYLALVGDASDCIPGAPGIGPVTARKLLAAYDSIDRIYELLDSGETPGVLAGISAKVVRTLRENRELVMQCRQLTRLRADVNGVPDLGATVFQGPCHRQLPALLRELGTPSLLEPLLRLTQTVRGYNAHHLEQLELPPVTPGGAFVSAPADFSQPFLEPGEGLSDLGPLPNASSRRGRKPAPAAEASPPGSGWLVGNPEPTKTARRRGPKDSPAAARASADPTELAPLVPEWEAGFGEPRVPGNPAEDRRWAEQLPTASQMAGAFATPGIVDDVLLGFAETRDQPAEMASPADSAVGSAGQPKRGRRKAIPASDGAPEGVLLTAVPSRRDPSLSPSVVIVDGRGRRKLQHAYRPGPTVGQWQFVGRNHNREGQAEAAQPDASGHPPENLSGQAFPTP